MHAESHSDITGTITYLTIYWASKEDTCFEDLAKAKDFCLICIACDCDTVVLASFQGQSGSRELQSFVQRFVLTDGLLTVTVDTRTVTMGGGKLQG